MARVAVVTGGTRGIGEAISVALRDAGMQVAANYAGNEEKARQLVSAEWSCWPLIIAPSHKFHSRYAGSLLDLDGFSCIRPNVIV